MASINTSFYKICKLYYGQTSRLTLKQKQNYGRSIGIAERIIKNVFLQKSFSPISEYLDSEYKSNLVIGFLEGFVEILKFKECILEEYLLLEDRIIIPLNAHYYKNIKLKLTFLRNQSKNQLALIAFGPSIDISIEIGILRCLYQKYSSVTDFDSYDEYEYWDLRNGTVEQILKDDIKEITIEQIMPAIYRLMDEN